MTRGGWRRSPRTAVAGPVVLAVAMALLSAVGTAAHARPAAGEPDQVSASDGTATVSGTVTDGSGHDWPLYAKITAPGSPGATSYTDPATGRYSIALPAGASHELRIAPVYPGYRTATESVDLSAGDAERDIAVPVDAATCTANGYRYTYDANFDSGTKPEGWTVTDNNGNGNPWQFDDPRNRTNRSGGTGKFASVDSDFYGAGNRPDSSLITPAVDLTDNAAPTIGFNQDFNYRSGELADVDLSLDGGTTWETVLRQTTDVRGPRYTTIGIPQAAGRPDVRVRFHYHNANFDGWWQLDNVYVGERTCDPVVAGAYVVGNVTDANTGTGLNGAAVKVGALTLRTAATPEDPALPDGFHWGFTTAVGTQDITASAPQYVTGTRHADVRGVTRADFSLAAGRLEVTPGALESALELGERTNTRTFTVANTGTARARLDLGESRGEFVMRTPDAGTTSRQQTESADGAPLQELQVPVSLAAAGSGEPGSGTPADQAPHADPWQGIADYPQNIMDNRVVTLDGRIYSIGGTDGSSPTAKVWAYDPSTLAWTATAPLPGVRAAMTVGVVNGRIVATSGWSSGTVEGSTWVYEPLADTWTPGAANPQPRSAAGQAVLDGKLYAVGGCTTSACAPLSKSVVAYDAEADTWERPADYPLAVAYLSCGALDGQVVCTGGNDGATANNRTYAYTPRTDTWKRVADAPAPTWGSGHAVANGELVVVSGVQGSAVSNAAYAYHRASDAWRQLPNANSPRYRGGAACGFYKIGGAVSNHFAERGGERLPGFDDCATGTADREWLSVGTSKAVLEPGRSVDVTVTFDARVDQPGTYTSAVWIRENTPYAAPKPVPVTLTVTPPRTWGQLTGTVRGIACGASPAPLAGATVTVDSATTGWTFTTDADGSYAYWIDRRDNPLTVYAAKDGFRPQGRTVRITAGTATAADFDLTGLGC